MHLYFDIYGQIQVHQRRDKADELQAGTCGSGCEVIETREAVIDELQVAARQQCAAWPGRLPEARHIHPVIRADLTVLCTWCGTDNVGVENFLSTPPRLADQTDLEELLSWQRILGGTEAGQLAWYRHQVSSGADWHLRPEDYSERSLNPHIMYQPTLDIIDAHLRVCEDCRQVVSTESGWPIEKVLRTGHDAAVNRHILAS